MWTEYKQHANSVSLTGFKKSALVKMKSKCTGIAQHLLQWAVLTLASLNTNSSTENLVAMEK